MINTYALIIGAAKSGTTSLFYYLSEHPEIAPSNRKEPQFFCQNRIFKRGFKYYQSLWDWNPQIHKVALEASPNYTRVTNDNLLNSAEKIAETQKEQNVKFKFIYIMRNPITRIESHYTHLEARGQEPNVKPFTAGIDREIIDISRYAMQLDEYYQRFSPNSILLLDFEDIKDNPQQLLKTVCQFLEIDDEYQFKALNVIYNSNLNRKKIILPGWKTIRRTNWGKAIIKTIPPSVKKVLSSLLGKKVERQIELSPEQQKYVLDYIQDDLHKLQQKYYVDISRWNLPQLSMSNRT